jgi:hypothetical protein
MHGILPFRALTTLYVPFKLKGVSTMTELAEPVGTFLEKSKDSLSSLDRLEMAMHVAWGLAELHSLQPMGDIKTQILTEEHSFAIHNPYPILFAHFDVKLPNLVRGLDRSRRKVSKSGAQSHVLVTCTILNYRTNSFRCFVTTSSRSSSGTIII